MTTEDRDHRAWMAFLRSPSAADITPGEARTLQSLKWMNGGRPTENVYRALLAIIRQAPLRERAQVLEPRISVSR